MEGLGREFMIGIKEINKQDGKRLWRFVLNLPWLLRRMTLRFVVETLVALVVDEATLGKLLEDFL